MSYPTDDQTTGATGAQSGTLVWLRPPSIRPVLHEAYDILIAAHRSDTESWRLDRLALVAREAKARRLGVTLLYDHKGTLSANFGQAVTQKQVDRLAQLWLDQNEVHIGGIYQHGLLVRGDAEGLLENWLPKVRNFLWHPDGRMMRTEEFTSRSPSNRHEGRGKPIT